MKIKQLLFIVLTILTFSSFIDSKQTIQKKHKNIYYKPSILHANNFDGNRIDCDIENNGMFVSHIVSGRSGLSWPKGYGTQTIYASGVWLGGIVDGQVLVSAGEFAGEFASGPWGADHEDEQYKIYKVNKSDLSHPQGFEDFQNWPVKLGAPWVDNNYNGIYEPLPNGPDHPEFIGDQVLWMVMNDGILDLHTVFNTEPMGLEVQKTVFGYDKADGFGDIMFIKDLIINKGNNIINDMYIGLWADPDLGDAADDFVGCDTTLGMGICYNDGDDVNFASYNGGTPAVGYDFLQGPMVPASGETAYMFDRNISNKKNLQMTSFLIMTKGPPFWDPGNAEEAYYYLKGLDPNGNPLPFEWSGGSKFTVPGDPTKNTGPDDTEYVDGDLLPSDDRRFIMGSGPFTMAPGDSQEVVYAVIHAADSGGALDSYLKLKQVDILAQRAYYAQFINGNPPPEPIAEVTELEDQIILTWDNSAESYDSEDLIDINPNNRETTKYIFEGYNVYQSENRNGIGELLKIATFDRINDVKVIMDDVFDEQYGVDINIPVQSGTDSGIKRSFSIEQDYINNTRLKLNREYYFIVTAYGYNEFGIPKTMESLKNTIIAVRPQIPNTWESTDTTAVYGTVTDNGFQTAGESDGRVYAKVVDPTQLTGDDYEMFFTTENYYQNINGVWINENAAGKKGLEKILDCSGSMVTFSALAAADGTYDLFFHFHIDCGSNWVDGISLDFPDGININSWGGIGDFTYGSDQGQNCGNMDGTLDAATNTLTWGSDARSGFGCIEGDQEWSINIDPTDVPFSVNYMVYDDGYDGTIVDVAEVAELGFARMAVEGWYARNLATGDIVTPHTTIQSGVATDNVVDGVFVPGHESGYDANPNAEGLQFIVESSQPGIKQVSETDLDNNILDMNVGVYPPSLGTTGFILSHRDHAGLGAGRDHDRFDAWVMDDVYIDFSETSFAWHYTEETGLGEIPYSVYRKKSTTGETVRLFAGYWDTDESGTWSIHGDMWYDYDRPSYEPIYAWQGYDAAGNEINYDPANDAQYAADNSLLTSANTTWAGGPGEFQFPFLTATLMVLYNDGATPPWGNKIMIITYKPLSDGDKFKLATSHLVGKTIEYNIDNIKVWPNPYFAYNPEERSRFNQEIHFTHLPETGICTIRIFDLAGALIRKIDHTNGTQFEIWDVRNDYNWKIASGMYIVHIETEESEKILKLAVIQPSN